MTASQLRLPGASPALDTSRTATLLARAAVITIAVAAIVVLSLFFDARVALAAKTLAPDAVAWGRLISDIGKSGWMFAVAGALIVGPLVARRMLRTRRFDEALILTAERAAYVGATLAAQGLAAQLIKHLVGRARPRMLPALGPYSFDVLSMKDTLASFPSGHTATAFAMATALTLLAPRLRVALFTLAVAIAASRVVVQAHYLSDLAAGCALGVATALVMARLFADRGMAFMRVGAGIRLRGPGVVAAALQDGAARS